MGKRKPLSLLKRDHAGANAKEPGAPKRQKTGAPKGPSYTAPKPQAAVASWQPVSLLHRQASHAVGRLLHADATGRHGATLKSLTLAPHIVSKKAVYAVTVQTLKHVGVLRQVIDAAALLAGAPRLPPPLAYVLVHDLLWGQGLRPTGPAECAVLDAADALRGALRQLLEEAGAADVASLLPAPAAPHPRTARVNALKMSPREALAWMRAPPPEHAALWAATASARASHHACIRTRPPPPPPPSPLLHAALQGQLAEVDGLLPDLLTFPPGTDLHDHPLVSSGALLLQSKASCMTAAALAPARGWRVLDACAAPGNKTTQLAALVAPDPSGSGSGGAAGGGGPAAAPALVLALDKSADRLARLQCHVGAAGAGALVEARCDDFLALDPEAAEFGDVRAVLLDPSCSGSGTAASRMDHLLPSASGRATGGAAVDHVDARVEALAAFQAAALRHALRFPAARRVAYSTCSLHWAENEGVVGAVLGDADVRAAGWELEAALPAWPRRGVARGEVVGEEEAGKLLRTGARREGARAAGAGAAGQLR
jgi:putative methyltransferase